MFMEGSKTPEKVKNETSKLIHKSKLLIIPAILIGFLLGIVSIVVLIRSNTIELSSKQYVYVDVEKVINEVNNNLLEQIKANKIEDKEVETKLLKAKEKFDRLLKNYAKNHNAIVISGNKVISGAKDITEYFISHLKEIE